VPHHGTGLTPVFKAFLASREIDALLQPFVYLPGAPFGRRNQRGKTMSKFLKLIRSTKGATAIEYGLIAALIAVAAIAAMQNIGSKLGQTFNNVSSELDT
jgi:pilus assembly protein Flp/PilA